MRMEMGLRLTALPTARGEEPRSAAKAPYVRVCPQGISNSRFQTDCWNALPAGDRGGRAEGRFPAK